MQGFRSSCTTHDLPFQSDSILQQDFQKTCIREANLGELLLHMLCEILCVSQRVHSRTRTSLSKVYSPQFLKVQLTGCLCANLTGHIAQTAMQALLASTCTHQVTAFSSSQHQHVCNVRALLVHTAPVCIRSDSRLDLCGRQCAQPSQLRRRAPLGAHQESGLGLPRQSLRLTASRSTRLHVPHATPRQSTKETDHRYALTNKFSSCQPGLPSLPYLQSV